MNWLLVHTWSGSPPYGSVSPFLHVVALPTEDAARQHAADRHILNYVIIPTPTPLYIHAESSVSSSEEVKTVKLFDPLA